MSADLSPEVRDPIGARAELDFLLGLYFNLEVRLVGGVDPRTTITREELADQFMRWHLSHGGSDDR